MGKAVEALKHVASGDSIDQTADDMNLSRSSVEKYLLSIRRQLNARNLMHAVHIATKTGLIVYLCHITVLDSELMRRNPKPHKTQQSAYLRLQVSSKNRLV